MNGIEKELKPQGVQVIHLDANSAVGQQLARQYGVRGVPTLIVLESTGEPVLRQMGRVDKESVLETFAQLGL